MSDIIFRTQDQASKLEFKVRDEDKKNMIELLEILKGTSHPFHKMKKIYETVDQFIGRDMRQKSVCSRGCNHCCKVNVSVTRVEAEYISARTGVSMNQDAVRGDTDYSKLPAPFNLCHFNVAGVCTIYEYRPLECRSFLTFDDPKYCEDPTLSHYIFGVRTSEVLQFIATLLMKVSELKYADIREWFEVDQ